jgi:hypothetical protein
MKLPDIEYGSAPEDLAVTIAKTRRRPVDTAASMWLEFAESMRSLHAGISSAWSQEPPPPPAAASGSYAAGGLEDLWSRRMEQIRAISEQADRAREEAAARSNVESEAEYFRSVGQYPLRGVRPGWMQVVIDGKWEWLPDAGK